jgi:hypothetical protein
MAYEAAAAVALRDQNQVRSREGKVEEGKTVVRSGVLRVLMRVVPLSKAPAPSSEKK